LCGLLAKPVGNWGVWLTVSGSSDRSARKHKSDAIAAIQGHHIRLRVPLQDVIVAVAVKHWRARGEV
jgi:hypothetical protein